MSKYALAGLALIRDVCSGTYVRDYTSAERHIHLRQAQLADGIEGLVADELVAQGTDSQGRHLATRGFHLYRLDADNRRFERVCRLPCPWGTGQLLHCPSLRRALSKQDVVQLLSLNSGAMLVHSCGVVYRRAADGGSFEPRLRLRFFGLRAGRGVLYNGLTQSRQGRVFLGEYFNNARRLPVRIYASDDDGRSWYVLHEFKAGQIRHIHAVHEDPYTGQIWVCAGDTDAESRVLCSDDGGKSFRVIGQGSQVWRCCSLLFDEEAVYWAADTEVHAQDRYLMRYRRADQQLEKLAPLDGAVEFAVQPETALQIYTTIRMGYGAVPDDRASVWLSDGDSRWCRIPLGARVDCTRGAASRIKVYHGAAERLACFSFANISGLDGQLAIVPTESLKHWFVDHAHPHPAPHTRNVSVPKESRY
jgi:hypothetical protein